MDKKLHCTFTLEGSDVDEINVYEILNSHKSDFDFKYSITSMNCNVYYTKKEET